MKFLVSLFLFAFSSSAFAQVSGNVLTIGDSLTAGLAGSRIGVLTCASLGGAVVASSQQRSCKGNGQRNIGGWQPGLSSIVAVNVYNFGNSGELSSEILARLNASMNARSSQFVLILAGTNDAIRGPSVSTVLNNLQTMINRVKAQNRIPVIGTLPPLLGGPFAQSNGKVLAINAGIKQFEDVEVADHYAVLLANWSSNTSGDFIHLGSSGNSLVARSWADAMDRALAEPGKPAASLVPTMMLLDDE